MKIGRNDKCPCGSGKKYKNCCLNAANIQQSIPSIKESIKNMITKGEETVKKLTDFFKNNLPKKDIDKYDRKMISSVIKAIRSYESILALSKNGEDENAAILFRSLFESTVTTYWLLFNKSKRSKRMTYYREKEIIDSYSLMSNIPQSELNKIKKEFNKLKEKYERLKKKYNAKDMQKLINIHKNKFPSIRAMTKEQYRINHKLQSFKDYYAEGTMYGYLSSFAHAGTFTQNTIFKRDIKNPARLGVKITPNPQAIPLILHNTNHFVILLFDLFNKMYGLELKDQEKINQEWNDLYEKSK